MAVVLTTLQSVHLCPSNTAVEDDVHDRAQISSHVSASSIRPNSALRGQQRSSSLRVLTTSAKTMQNSGDH